MFSIMDNLKTTNKRIDRVNTRLDTIKILYAMSNGSIVETIDGVLLNEDINISDLLSNRHVSVTHVVYKKGNKHYPAHCHEKSVEYLIVTKGKLFIRFQEGFSRVVLRGECVAIPIGCSHSGYALEDGTELIAICVPPEPAYNFKVKND